MDLDVHDSKDALAPKVVHPWVAEGRHRVRFGFDLSFQPDDLSVLIDVVQRAEAEGMDGYWCYDHPLFRAECWNTMSVLAAATTTIRLASSMSCIYYRSPYMLARQAADVDRLSGGRLILGLGVGDAPHEFRKMGVELPPMDVRQRGLVETVAIVRGLWSGESFEHRGEQWSVACDAGEFLGPVQLPHVPIVIGGGGERYTLRNVARFADASNMGPMHVTGGAVTDADVERKFGKLREFLQEQSRPDESVLRSHFVTLVIAQTAADVERKLDWALAQRHVPHGGDKARAALLAGMVVGTPDAVIEYYRRLVALGFQYFVANVMVPDYETVELMGKHLIPAFA